MEILRTTLAATGIGLACASLAACASEPGLEYNRPGVIVDHYYDDQDIVAVKPIIIDPEHFLITIRQCDLPADTGTECRDTTVEVSERYYNDYTNGTQLSADEVNALKN